MGEGAFELWLKQFMARNDFTVRSLAAQLNIPPMAISRIKGVNGNIERIYGLLYFRLTPRERAKASKALIDTIVRRELGADYNVIEETSV